MNKKVDSDLEPVSGEKVLYEAHPSMFRNHPIWFLACLLLTFVIPIVAIILVFVYTTMTMPIFISIAIVSVIGLISFGVWWLKCKATTLTVTSERTSCRRGILSKNITEVWHQDIRNVQLDQTLLQRVLDVGRIGISSAGQSGLEISVAGVPNPESVKRLIDEHRRRE